MSEFQATTERVTGVRAAEEDFRSAEWVQSNTSLSASAVTLEPLLDAGGLCGTMRKLTVTSSSGEASTYILKFTAPENTGRGKSLGLPREAFFYNNFGARLREFVPEVPFAFGDMDSGDKTILMTDLSSYAQSGYFFGACSPHNWRKDLTAITTVEEGPARQELTHKIALHAFQIAAKIHASFWNDRSLLSHSWLRSSDWYSGEGKESWTVSQNWSLGLWQKNAAKIAAGESKINWNPHLLACMDASMAKISWEDYQAAVTAPGYVFTLVHGDYHPANMMWKSGNGGDVADSLVLLDWEAVGAGSGPQDLAQYVISHMYPAERRAWESDLLAAYHESLVAGGVNGEEYTLEKCRADYVAGGVGRWVWLLALLTSMCPDDWVQFFHDQLAAFIEDHGVTPENIVMPRV